MKGWMVREFGGPEVMVWEALDDPVPGPGQVLVAVKASGVNFAETRMRSGEYAGQPLPFVMGMEGAGLIAALGPGVTEFAIGDRVFGRARGCHAELALFDAAHLMPMPDPLSFLEAAAVPVGWQTAWHALETVCALRPGETVLIEAVASSVGSAALQIAKAKGAWVIGTASRDDKLEVARAWGCDLTVNYKTEDLPAKVRAATGGEGAHVGLMTIGEETAPALFASMANEGRLALYGSTSGKTIAVNLAIGSQNLELRSMSISTSPKFLPVTMPHFKKAALPLFASGAFKPVLDTVLPLADVARAHQMISERRHFGKVVLEV